MPLHELILFGGALGLILIGIAGVVLSDHLFRAVLALAIAEAGANLLLVLGGFRWDAVAPILVAGQPSAQMVDPIPQAMVLTSIVIGVGVQALAMSLLLRIRAHYGTLRRTRLARPLACDLDTLAGLPCEGQHELPTRPSPRRGGDPA